MYLPRRGVEAPRQRDKKLHLSWHSDIHVIQNELYINGILGSSAYKLKGAIMRAVKDACPEGYRWVITPYIRRKGKIIYPKKAKVFRFLVKN